MHLSSGTLINNMSTPKANYLKFMQNVSKQKNARFNFALYRLFRSGVMSLGLPKYTCLI